VIFNRVASVKQCEHDNDIIYIYRLTYIFSSTVEYKEHIPLRRLYEADILKTIAENDRN